MATVRVVAPSRLHLGLLDLAGFSRRRYGGVGMMITAHETTVVASPSKASSLHFDTEVSLSHSEAVREALHALLIDKGVTVAVRVCSAAPAHSGLGSKTTLVLAALEAANRALSLNVPRQRLQSLSRRGGTSGIGVHGFFEGGFLIDGGHPDTGAAYAPSRESAPASIPPLLVRLPFPRDWRIWLLWPQDGRVVQGRDEVAFFAKHTPVPKTEVAEAGALALLGLAGSVAATDFLAFRQSLQAYQFVGFKRREIQSQPGAESGSPPGLVGEENARIAA